MVRPQGAPRGALGEKLACLFLESRGYTILERNLRVGRRELDVIAERGSLLVAVEVKWRAGGETYGGAVSSWSGPQRRRAAEAAIEVRRTRPEWLDRPWRFDLVTIDEKPRGWTLVHHPGAWSPRASWW